MMAAIKGNPERWTAFKKEYNNSTVAYILLAARTRAGLLGLSYRDISDLTEIPVKTLEGWFQETRIPPRYVALYLLWMLEQGLYVI